MTTHVFIDVTGVDAGAATLKKALSTAELIHAASLATGVPTKSLTGRSRIEPIAHARQLAMVLLRESTDLTLIEIGRIFNRDHGTVIHAIKAVASRRETDAKFAALYAQLISQAKA